jgi:uncharacterized protein (DUF1697 family)
MTQYVALLRGINVGGKSKVEMKKLKAIFETLGYENVSTYINSGNVIFTTAEKDTQKIVADIEHALAKKLGMQLRVVVRDAKNIQKLVKAIPAEWLNNAEQKTDILFLWDAYDTKKSLGLIKQCEGVDTLLYISGAIVWNIDRVYYSKSGMQKFIGTELYKHMTARNVNTVRKLFEKMS